MLCQTGMLSTRTSSKEAHGPISVSGPLVLHLLIVLTQLAVCRLRTQPLSWNGLSLSILLHVECGHREESLAAPVEGCAGAEEVVAAQTPRCVRRERKCYSNLGV